MNKFALIIMALLLMLTLVACTDNEGDGEKNPGSSSYGESTPAEPSDTEEIPDAPDESDPISTESVPEQPETDEDGYIELPRVDF